jgi:hypothetical protein
MSNSLKAQGSSEYLILLAVVLIIAIVAIALIGGFVDLGAGSMETQSKQYWTGSARPFSVPDYAQQNDTFIVTLKNMEPTRIMITAISVGGDVRVGNVSFNGGATKTVNVNMSRVCDAESYDFFEYDVIINYTTTNDVQKSQIGEKPFVGKCLVVN